MYAKLLRDGEVRMLKLEYRVQQDAALPYHFTLGLAYNNISF